MAPAREEEQSRSFDPGLSTGYLRRGARDHDLPVEIGAAPFDPGPGTGYDERRARREAKRKQRLEEQRRKRLAKLEEEIERREAAEREARAREERERRERIERELAERERIDLEARERAQREEREGRQAAQRERERRERERRELQEKRRRELEAGLERERREQQRIVREREERDRALRERRERRQRQRKQQARRQAKRRPATAQRPRRPAKKPGLAWPTARAALALAAVSAVAGVFGTAIGLPVPVLGEPGGPIAASLTGNPVLDAGTPPGPTRGPYFPVDTDNPDFGEADAKFGALRSGHIHRGQDVFAKPGTPLVAVRDGIVIDGARGKGFYAYGGGNSLVIYSPVDDRSYVYLHMLRPALVRAGETVRAGQPVGQVGCTGSCFGPHLHFEIRLGRVAHGVERKAIDPLPLLQQWPAAPSP